MILDLFDPSFSQNLRSDWIHFFCMLDPTTANLVKYTPPAPPLHPPTIPTSTAQNGWLYHNTFFSIQLHTLSIHYIYKQQLSNVLWGSVCMSITFTKYMKIKSVHMYNMGIDFWEIYIKYFFKCHNSLKTMIGVSMSFVYLYHDGRTDPGTSAKYPAVIIIFVIEICLLAVVDENRINEYCFHWRLGKGHEYYYGFIQFLCTCNDFFFINIFNKWIE